VGTVITARRILALALVALGGALHGGCSEMAAPLSQLPDISKLPERVLSKDQQRGKVDEMIETGQNHQSEAAKQIERGR
jgi:hypothetical protein